MAAAPTPLRTVFFGTPAFAVTPLRALFESQVADVVAVVCQPDKPKGRGRKVAEPETKRVAREHDIPVLQPAKLRRTDFASELAAFKPDVVVVAAYGKILPKDVLDAPRLGCINIHASILPKYRGAAPIQWALLNGERETGVTIMQMDEGCDTGPIIAAECIDILEDDDSLSVSNMLSVLGGKLIVEILEDVARTGRVVGVAQDDSQATLAPMLKKEDGVLDWSQPAAKVLSRIRGLNPWPSAQTAAEKRALKILSAENIPADHPGAEPGDVVETDSRRGFVVATGDGFLLVTKVQPAGRAAMSGADAANGGHVKQGQVLRPPA